MKLKIVIIDDDECIRDTFQWHLEDLGHEVMTAKSPEHCDVYQGHTCSKTIACGDVLLIDYNMPGMNGLDYIEKLKKRGCKGITSNLLLMSGNTTEIDMVKARALDCTVFQKPMTFDQLEEWLEGVKIRINQTDLAV